MDIKTQIEPIELIKQTNKDYDIIKLSPLQTYEIDIIDPIVPPTSGLRMEIYEKRNNLFLMTAEKQYRFLRVFKAISIIAKKELNKSNPNVLIVSDDRPSASHLLEYCAKIFAYDGYKLFFQTPLDIEAKKNAQNDPYYSRMSTPYASGSIVLVNDLDVIIQITASHNALDWNGIKFYIGLPIPISGPVMKAVSKVAIELTEISLNHTIHPQRIDADGKNNDYIIQLLQKIIDVSVLKSKKVLFWPHLGNAPELQDLFKRLGVDLVVVNQQMDPPDPTKKPDEKYIHQMMKDNGINIAILVDADRDRVVFVLKNKKTEQYITLSPNELYTAMHNLLAIKLGQKIINVRTVPSDPRSDGNAIVNFITGVGYKHLGMVLYSAINQEIDPQKFDSGIFYVPEGHAYKKVSSPAEIRKIILEKCGNHSNLIMVLWEESGGHTFDLLEISDHKVRATLPVIGDKYPAPAIIILSALIEMGYDLANSVDRSIIGTRTTLKADDAKKMKIVNYFAGLKGQRIEIGDYSYNIDNFEQVDGKVDIILLKSATTEIYFRPSGTGPEVRIYVFGPDSSAQKELEMALAKIDELFP